MDGILKSLLLLHDPEDIVEIRSIDPKPTVSGYFRADSPNILDQIARFPNRTFYQTINCVNPGCYARGQHETLLPYPKETTSDNDIIGYNWILIDADPVRPSGVSATDSEKENAHTVARKVFYQLRKLGFFEPIVADSGNGYHLLYKIKAELSSKDTISDFLKVLDMSTRYRADRYRSIQSGENHQVVWNNCQKRSKHPRTSSSVKQDNPCSG